MEKQHDITLAEKYAATLDWWRDAGVDFDFVDEAQPLLQDEDEPARPAPAMQQAEQPEAPPEPAIKAADLPGDLEGFVNWWVGPENPFASGHANRLAPIGKQGAPIMVLAAMPEPDDRDTLLAGSQGKLIANVLRAIGIDPNLAYLASALPCHTTLPDWDALGSDGLGTALVHHVALAKPQRLLLFGSKLPALFGHNQQEPPENFVSLANTPTLTTFAPDRLLDHARQRARLWKRLCQWTASV